MEFDPSTTASTPTPTDEDPVGIEVRKRLVESADGASVEATIRAPAELDEAAPIFVILPAMGVRATFYHPLAEALAQHGCPSLAADLRGIGTSSVRAGRRADFGYRELVELDLPALFAATAEEFPGRDLYCCGHSLGGQMSCLAVAGLSRQNGLGIAAPKGLVLVASCSVYYGSWRGIAKAGLLAFVQSAHLLSRVLGYFPGHRVGFGGREARGVVRDWSHQGTTGRYRLHGASLDYEAQLAEVRIPVLAISFEDDSYSPAAAVEHLLAKLGSPSKIHQRVRPGDWQAEELGHFGWIRRPKKVVQRVTDWLSTELGAD